MPRPRKFDIEQAIEAATHAFWKNGYEATSVQDLLDAMGLQKGSMYNSFGDKHELFLLCLSDYLDKGYAMLTDCIDSEGSPKVGLMKAFDMVKEICNDPSGKGCLCVNSMTELGSHDAEVEGLLAKHYEKIGVLVKQTVQEGQRLGEFRSDVDPEGFAKMLLTMQAGLLSGSKSFLGGSDVNEITTMIFKTVEA